MKDKPQGYAHLTAKIDSLQEQLHLCNVDQLSTAAELAAAIEQRDKARNEALELAAQVCEQPTDEIQISDDRSTYLYKDWYDCAAAIRAVKECGNG